MSQKKELAKNTLILGIGKLSTQFVAFLLVPLYTFFLSPSQYGTVDLIVTYTMLLAPVLTLQFEMAAFRFLVDARENEEQKARVIANVMQVVLAVVIAITIAYAITDLLIDIPYGLLVLGIVIANMFLGVLMQMARGLGKNKDFTLASIAIALTNIMATIWLVVLAKCGIEGVLGAILFANALGAFYLFFRLNLHKYISVRNHDVALKKEFVHYSLPLIPNGISWWVISLFDRTVITLFLGVAANGIYAVSSKYATVFTSIFSIFGMSWMESASMHLQSKNRDTFFTDVFRISVRAFGSFALLLIAALPFIFGIISKDYAEAYMYIPILIAAAFFNAIVGLYSAIYIARKMTKQVMATTLVAAAINITVNLVLITFIGLYAAAVATAVAYCAMAIYRHFDIKSFIHITYEKHVVLTLGLLYGVIVYLYYLQIPVANYISMVLAVICGIALNAHTVRAIVRK